MNHASSSVQPQLQLSFEFPHCASGATGPESTYQFNPFLPIGAQCDTAEALSDHFRNPPSVAPIEPKPQGGKTSIADELAYMLSDDFIDPLESYDGPKIALYEKIDVLNVIDTAESCDQESKEKIYRIVKNLLAHGQFRKLQQISPDFFMAARKLQNQFEQFHEVIRYVVGCSMMSMHRQDRVLRMSPILLSGDPGLGKTEFSMALAKLLKTPFRKIDMSSAQNNSALAGSSSFYSNASPGKIFQLASHGDYGDCPGNPIVLLDELDKGSSIASFGGVDPSGPLLSLLERHSAEHFGDLCIDIPINVSYFNYIATCNFPEMITTPIRSRFKEFHVSLTNKQKNGIAVKIVDSLLAELQSVDLAFDSLAVDALAALESPRLMKQQASDAIGSALLAHRDVILPTDIPGSKTSRRAIGFL